MAATSLLETAVEWDGHPADRSEEVAGTGLDPDGDLVVGVLTSAWNGHPIGAVVVSELMIDGLAFAVSTTAR